MVGGMLRKRTSERWLRWEERMGMLLETTALSGEHRLARTTDEMMYRMVNLRSEKMMRSGHAPRWWAGCCECRTKNLPCCGGTDTVVMESIHTQRVLRNDRMLPDGEGTIKYTALLVMTHSRGSSLPLRDTIST